MTYKKKSMLLLLVFSLSFFPVGTGQAEDSKRTFEEARSLLYLGDAFLEQETNLDTAVDFSELMAPAPGIQRAEGAEEVMDRMIHAAKQERNDLDANCNQLKSRYQIAGNQDAARKVAAYCRAEHQKLTNRIEFLRKLRGDRRKLFTRWWHSIKRSSANLWQQIGPLGRNIFRKVGDEAFNTVVSGGSLNSGVVRRLAKQAFKSTAREKMKQIIFRGVERLLEDQIRIAREAGVLDAEDDDGATDQDILIDDQEDILDGEEQDGQEAGQAEAQPEEGEDCPGDSSWVAPYWDEVIQPRLIAEWRTCQQTATAIYKSCLQDQGIQGVCPEEALEQCDHLYRAIPRTETSGAVTQNLTVMHSEAENVSASLVYNGSGGGGVQGEISYVLKDSHLCTITVSSTLSGSFDPGTCTLSGTAQVTEVYAGAACASVCSADTCPVTRSASVPWQATLEDGKISGGVNGNSSSVSGFGFGTP